MSKQLVLTPREKLILGDLPLAVMLRKDRAYRKLAKSTPVLPSSLFGKQ